MDESKTHYGCSSLTSLPLKRSHTSMSNTYNVFENLHMQWMCINESIPSYIHAPVPQDIGGLQESRIPP